MLTPAEIRDMNMAAQDQAITGVHPALHLARAVEAATLATVTPLVQQMLTLKVQFEQDLIATVTNGTPTNRLIAEQYDNAAARLSAFLSGATKESTDAL